MNVQYALKDGEIYVLEVNPRASRTVPFVAKVIGQPIAKIAARVMAGEPLARFAFSTGGLGHVGVKEAVFPFARFPGVDTVLGPEMRSTGEVMGLDRTFAVAFAKSQLGAGSNLPRAGTVFVSVRDADKPKVVAPLKLLRELGFKVVATGGTAALPRAARHAGDQDQQGLGRAPACRRRDAQRRRPADVQHHRGGDLARRFEPLRRAALLQKTPYYTTLAGAIAAAEGIKAYLAGDLEVRALQDYFA